MNQDALPLSFVLVLVDNTVIATLGDAVRYMAVLPVERRDWVHWTVARRMVDEALQDSEYLMAATLSLRTALLLDCDLSRPLLVDP
jgi:hypothetical protein